MSITTFVPVQQRLGPHHAVERQGVLQEPPRPQFSPRARHHGDSDLYRKRAISWNGPWYPKNGNSAMGDKAKPSDEDFNRVIAQLTKTIDAWTARWMLTGPV